MTPIACVVTAMARNTRARPTNVSVLAPSVAWSTTARTTSGPARASARAGGQEHAEDGPTLASGRRRATRARPREGDGSGHQDILSARSGRDSGGFTLSDPLTGWFVQPGRGLLRSPCMEQDTATLEAPESTDELVEEELLVEEISIDGMCGVY